VSLVCGCGGAERLAPEAVSSTWAKETLEKTPDIVMSIDVAALQRDPFFSKLVDTAMADAAKPWDAILTASRVDVFATIAKRAFTAVAYDVGALPPALAECFGADLHRERITVTDSAGKWIASNVATHGGAGARVEMDGHALFEAWLGPGAFDEALSHARWDEDELWRHLLAARVRVEGGATPGIFVDSRFETSVDAEHAMNDVGRARRRLERVIDEVRDEELANQMRAQLAGVHVARNGGDVHVEFHLTAGFTQHLSRMIDREQRPHSRQGGC
jgi:hypothetical protein